jgi:FtsH-binding integral membrane protein
MHVMSENDQDNRKKKSRDSSSPWPFILALCAIGALLFVAGQVEKASPGAGRVVFGAVVGVGFVALVLYIVVGSSIRETLANIKGILKALAGLLVFFLIIGGVTRCASSPDADESGVGGVPDQWRKP